MVVRYLNSSFQKTSMQCLKPKSRSDKPFKKSLTFKNLHKICMTEKTDLKFLKNIVYFQFSVCTVSLLLAKHTVKMLHASCLALSNQHL